ncbi:MAG: acetyl-coenzyme A synthetase N-terminal domain-containing protein, partial [Caulobacter sp.]
MVSDGQVFPVPADLARDAHIDAAAYDAALARVEADPEGYWRDIAARLDWITPPTKIKDVSYAKEDFRIRWYEDGVLNVSANCIDR